MKFALLHSYNDGNEVYINLDYIVSIVQNENSTTLFEHGNEDSHWVVKETVHEILKIK